VAFAAAGEASLTGRLGTDYPYSAADPLSGFANWKFSLHPVLLLPSWTRNLKALPGVAQRLARSVFQQLACTLLTA